MLLPNPKLLNRLSGTSVTTPIMLCHIWSAYVRGIECGERKLQSEPERHNTTEATQAICLHGVMLCDLCPAVAWQRTLFIQA